MSTPSGVLRVRDPGNFKGREGCPCGTETRVLGGEAGYLFKTDLTGSCVEGIGTILALHCWLLSPGAPQKEVYFMGLIDILTQYDAKKKAAHAAKTVKHGVRVPQCLSFLVLTILWEERASYARAVEWQKGEVLGMETVRSGMEGGEGGRVAGWPDTLFHTSSHRLGQRSLLSTLSSMLSDSWILLPTSLPKRLRGGCYFMFKVVEF